MSTYQTYHLTTTDDGTIAGTCETNDPEDRGFASGFDSWPVSYRNRADMDKRAGKSRIGCAGCVVTVYLDGEKL